ncbi:MULTISPECIES: hypothetical protein [Micrococcaceae]|uniref:hypothetical protein n=1 Tax=Micrococcaceae TaxID=1268 RepID=UPI000B5E184B|nr:MULTISPECIES: hypothetical protein [Micrococcaceae]ASN19225.1 hypothetical protein CGK93_05595 [Arthrobacter sp. YN]MCD4853413.1 hypothetical protein [Arthrobacter sp. AK01]MCP1412795.1 hypothetical protein [Paenarthrobacter sp. A20]
MIDAPELLATVTATSKTTMEINLNAAIQAAEQRARNEGRCGILVTRLDYASYTVELSPDVPYGYTYEKHDA